VAGLLRAVLSENPRVRRAAYDRLASVLGGGGWRCEAHSVAARFLIDVVADSDAADRYAACQILAIVGVGDQASWLSSPPDLASVRRDVQRRAGMTVEELKQERAAWVAAAPNEQHREARARRADFADLELERDTARWVLHAYDTVRAGMPVYLAALSSPQPALQLYAAFLVAWFPEEQETAAPALAKLLAAEERSVLASTACVAAGLCAPRDDPALVRLLEQRRRSQDPVERRSAVLGLARLVSTPDCALVEELYDCLVTATEPVPNWPFLHGDMSTMAAFAIRDLDPTVAADRVGILVNKLAVAAADVDEYLLLRALLEAVFPNGPIADGVTFAHLDADQRRAVLALWQTRALSKGAMTEMLVDSYRLPHDEAALQAWCGL
jgi:hypothetical protein